MRLKLVMLRSGCCIIVTEGVLLMVSCEELECELVRVERAYCVKRAERERVAREIVGLWEERSSLLYRIAQEELVSK